MAGMPTLKTGRLVCPTESTRGAVRRLIPAPMGTPYEGEPDKKSPAQRTLHQSLLNRRIGPESVYHHLHDHGFQIDWDWQPPNMPQAGLALAFHHEPAGPRLGIILRNGGGRAPYEDDLLTQGWHVLVLEPGVVVQMPHDVVDAILAVLTRLTGLDLGVAARQDDGPMISAAPAIARPVKIKQPGLFISILRPTAMTVFLMGCLHFGMALVTNPESHADASADNMSFRAKVSDIAFSPEGNALIQLKNGKHTYLPAHAMRHNPNRLHDLIVAWRQGKPLTVFTTSVEHDTYGRQVGIKDLATRQNKGHTH